MKTKITLPVIAFLLPLLLIAIVSKAQQPNSIPAHTANNAIAANYTYKVFQAPNKNFGYDILQNDKIVYHEFASLNQPGDIARAKNAGVAKINGAGTASVNKENPALVKEVHAEKAALLAIEKLKRKESPSLSQDEVRKIIAQ